MCSTSEDALVRRQMLELECQPVSCELDIVFVLSSHMGQIRSSRAKQKSLWEIVVALCQGMAVKTKRSLLCASGRYQILSCIPIHVPSSSREAR